MTLVPTLLLAAALAALPAPPAPTPEPASTEQRRWTALSTVEQEALLKAWAQEPLERRLVDVSARFLGTPYVGGPLGPGPGKEEPVIRDDGVDCLTYIEQIIALALAPSPESIAPLLQQLRYRAEPTYEDRNHLMEAEWLPNNVAKGFLEQVTARYGGETTFSTQETIEPGAWKTPIARGLRLPPARQVVGSFPLNVIPLAHVLDAARTAPSGTVLVVIREERPLKVTRVSHLGFLVHDGKRLLVRHATKGWVNRVTDEELGHFLARIQRHNGFEPRKVVGVSMYAVREQFVAPVAPAPPDSAGPSPRTAAPVERGQGASGDAGDAR